MKDLRFVDLAATMRQTMETTLAVLVNLKQKSGPRYQAAVRIIHVSIPYIATYLICLDRPRHKKQKLSEANYGDDAGSASKEEDQITGSSAYHSRVVLAGITYSTNSGRFSRYKNPKISENKSHGRLVAASKKEEKDKGKAPAKGRNFGKLAYLKDMSLDILFEVRVVF